MDLKKEFAKEMKEYERIRLASISAQRKFDDASLNSKNSSNKLRLNLEKVQIEEKAFKKAYAKKIYDKLSETQPMLIRRRDQQVVAWSDAFGKDFDMISEVVQGSIIALVEENGGQYRLS